MHKRATSIQSCSQKSVTARCELLVSEANKTMFAGPHAWHTSLTKE